MKSSVTVNLVAQIRFGPWIFREELEQCILKASAFGFDGIELFTASADAVDKDLLMGLLRKYSLQLSAVGTGAGKVLHGLTLTDREPLIRQKATSFIKEMIGFGAHFGAPAIVGSIQGSITPETSAEQALVWLSEGLDALGEYAMQQEVTLLFEPLNRYESNLVNRLEDAVRLIAGLKTRNIRLLADLFHMNIEESSIADSIRNTGSMIGYLHFADSNRRPAGNGHISMREIASALNDINYQGFISAEALPYPNPDVAAQTAIETFRKYFTAHQKH
jgi:sugar phosphate isomerase/epimerase